MAILALFSFSSPYSGNLPFQPVKGYSLVEGKQPASGQYAQMIFREQILHMFFTKQDKANKKSIDFENNTLVCMVAAKSKVETTITLDKILKENKKLLFYFVSKKGKSVKNGMIPWCLYSMKRDKDIHGIAYYLDGQLVEDVKN